MLPWEPVSYREGKAKKVQVRFKDKQEYVCPISHVKNSTTLRVGDKRKVQWTDEHYYPAKISKIGLDGLVDVIYMSDKVKHKVSFEKIDNANAIQVGDMREVRWKDRRFYEAKIIKLSVGDAEGVKKKTATSGARLLQLNTTHPEEARVKEDEGEEELVDRGQEVKLPVEPTFVKHPEQILMPAPEPTYVQSPEQILMPAPELTCVKNPEQILMPTPEPTCVKNLEQILMPTPEPTCVRNPKQILIPTPEPTCLKNSEQVLIPAPERTCVKNPEQILMPTPEPTCVKNLEQILMPTPEPTCVRNPEQILMPTPEPTCLKNLEQVLIPAPERTCVKNPEQILMPTPEPTCLKNSEQILIPVPEPTCVKNLEQILMPTPEPTCVQSSEQILMPAPEPTCVQSLEQILMPAPEPTCVKNPEHILMPTPELTWVKNPEPTCLKNSEQILIPAPEPTCVQSPEQILMPAPEQTCVQSPEQILMPTPELVNWTVPLDTFTVTQNVHENSSSTRSNETTWHTVVISSDMYTTQQASTSTYGIEECQNDMQGLDIALNHDFIFTSPQVNPREEIGPVEDFLSSIPTEELVSIAERLEGFDKDSFDFSDEEPNELSKSDHDYVPSDSTSEAGSDSSLGMHTQPELGLESATNETHLNEETSKYDKQLTVGQVKKKENGKRFWDQKTYCLYCECLVTNFNRHIERKHGNEIEVGRLLASSPKKKRILSASLRKKGNFLHNKKAIATKEGSLIVGRRPSANVSPDDFLPCPDCFGFYKKQKLYKHSKLCKKKKTNPDIESRTKGRNLVQAKGSMMLHDNDEFQLLNTRVFSTMKVDPISTVAKCDKVICKFGSRCLNKSTEKHSKSYISNRLRELGRLLIEIRTQTGTSNDLQHYLTPQKYTTVVKAVKAVANYDPLTGVYGTPSLATKLGHSLRQCAEIVECQGLTNDEAKVTDDAKAFQTILDKNWQYDVSSRAIKSLEEKKWNKPNMLPLAKDIQSLNKYIRNMEKSCKEAFEKGAFSESTWRCLNEVTIAHTILLNRRRSGEVQRIHLNSFMNVINKTSQEEIFESLNETEKMLSKTLIRLEIRGKRGRVVPVLFTPSIKESLDILIKYRLACNVLESNPYLFAIPNTSEGMVRGADALRKLSKVCGAEAPHFLTSTKLRKHVATVSQILNLNYKDLEQLAKFMGHDINIHNNFYRLPDQTVQIAKLGKLFLALEKGNISKYKGKSIDDIDVNIEADELSDVDSENDEEETTVQPPPLDQESNSYKTKKKNPIKRTVTAENDDSTESDSESEKSKKRKKRTFKIRKQSVRRPWSQKEKDAVLRHLHKNILLLEPPGKAECMACKNKEPVLQSRDWKNIKDWIWNQIKNVQRDQKHIESKP